jgi:hypothetical protein
LANVASLGSDEDSLSLMVAARARPVSAGDRARPAAVVAEDCRKARRLTAGFTAFLPDVYHRRRMQRALLLAGYYVGHRPSPGDLFRRHNQFFWAICEIPLRLTLPSLRPGRLAPSRWRAISTVRIAARRRFAGRASAPAVQTVDWSGPARAARNSSHAYAGTHR